jgi:hypothetical protein
MPTGMCKLCMKDKNLQRSHLVPAGAFKPLRAKQSSNPNPLIVTNSWIGQSSDQTAAHVFCRECEDVFNKGGETWLIPQLAQLDGFPLYDTLTKAQPLYSEGDFLAYRASSIPGFDAVKVIHFAMGIFWKASVQNWGNKGTEVQIMLGAYAEPIRQFILGRAPFPERTFLSVCILPPTVPLLAVLMPVRTKQREFHRFKFYVPGIEFALNIGNEVPSEVRESCIASGTLELVTLSPEFARTMGKNYVDALNIARISPGFAKHLATRGRS